MSIAENTPWSHGLSWSSSARAAEHQARCDAAAARNGLTRTKPRATVETPEGELRRLRLCLEANLQVQSDVAAGRAPTPSPYAHTADPATCRMEEKDLRRRIRALEKARGLRLRALSTPIRQTRGPAGIERRSGAQSRRETNRRPAASVVGTAPAAAGEDSGGDEGPPPGDPAPKQPERLDALYARAAGLLAFIDKCAERGQTAESEHDDLDALIDRIERQRLRVVS
jgi:hypothetical protein